MLEFPRWKYVVILFVVLLATLYALPNIYPQDPSVQITSNRGAATGVELDATIGSALAEAGVTPKSIDTEGEGERMVRLASLEDQTRAADALRPALGDDYVVALNLASTVPDWLSWFGAKPMLLGLDLQGGVHFVLQVDQKAALDKRLDAYADEVRSTLRDNRVRYESVERRGDGTIIATLVGLVGGAVALVGVAAIVKMFGRLERDATLSLGSAVGTTGTVYLSIPGQRAGPGKVHVNVQSRLVECLAVTDEDALPTGASVLVVDVEGRDTVVVVRNPILLNEVSNVGA